MRSKKVAINSFGETLFAFMTCAKYQKTLPWSTLEVCSFCICRIIIGLLLSWSGAQITWCKELVAVGRPKDSEAKKCIKVLEKEFGWRYEEVSGKSHVIGFLTHPSESKKDQCKISVNGTANNTARFLWAAAKNRCSHGFAPKRNQW